MGPLDKDENEAEPTPSSLEDSSTPQTDPESAPETEIKPKKAEKTEKTADPELKPRPANTYVLKQGDNPSKVALDIYGRVGAARELVLKNRGAKWQAGDVIKLL